MSEGSDVAFGVDPVDMGLGQLAQVESLKTIFDLSGKVALVTGSVGLAMHVINRLGECGASVVFMCRTKQNGRRVEQIMRDKGYKVTYFQGDVSKPEDNYAAVELAESTYGTIDIVVPVAAFWKNRAFVDVTPEDLAEIVNIDTIGQYFTVQAAVKSMIRGGKGGKVVTIASVAHRADDLPNLGTMTMYNLAKGGVVSMTRGIAKELKQYGINVNCVAPGSMMTPGAMGNTFEAVGLYGEEFMGAMMEAAQLVPGSVTPDDVARVILCLCTDIACFMYGQVVEVDGGSQYSFQKRPWSITMESGVPGATA